MLKKIMLAGILGGAALFASESVAHSMVVYPKVAARLPRTMFVELMGLPPTLQVDIPQWNWYGFPTTFTAAQFVVHLVGFLLAGLVVAKIVP